MLVVIHTKANNEKIRDQKADVVCEITIVQVDSNFLVKSNRDFQ